jgi:signal transduction histidine kinase
MSALPTPPPWLTWRSGLLCAPLMLVIWMGVSSFRNQRSFNERVAGSDRIFALLSTSTDLLTELEDAESGQRGFLLTGKESYLVPYFDAIEKIDRNFEKLVPTAGSIPNGSERLAQMKELSNSKLAELKQTIDLYHSAGLAPALAVVGSDAGLHDMTRIRSEMIQFIEDAYTERTGKRNATVALQIKELNRTLEHKVRDRTQALEEANSELEAFCYSVSHDLRAPLRSVDGFAKMLARDYANKPLDARGNDLMDRMSASTIRMGQLIEDLLNLSRIARGTIETEEVDLSGLAAEVAKELAVQNPGRQIEVSIEPDLSVTGDARLLRVALENLFGNAWKFTRAQAQPGFRFGRSESAEGPTFFVRDNGVGFDMAHSAQLFVPFQRLHSDSEFEGTGIGLATVQRVIHSHGGRIWAESRPGMGATFYFTIQTEGRRVLDRDETDFDGGGQSGRRVAHA